jgi:inner membrane transporter RhtA
MTDDSARIGLVRPVPPQVLLLGGIASVQFGAAFAVKLFAQAGPAGVVLLRLALAALMLSLAVRPSLRGRTRKDYLAVLAYGLILGTMNWSFYEAIGRLPLGVAVTIEFTGPLAVAVAGSRRALDGLWVLLAGGGVVLLAFRGDSRDITGAGVALALLAGACWAGYILVSQRVGQTWAQVDGLAVALWIGTLVVVPAGIIQGGSALLRPSVLAGGAAVAILSSILPYSFELIALRRLRAATFGLLMSLEPAVAALAGMLLLSQPLRVTTVVAIVMVVAASIGTTLSARGPAPQPELVSGR